MVDETVSTFGPVGSPGADPLRVGERIDGKYQLTRILGRGGMSSVFEAEDVDLSRRVAVKVVDNPQTGADLLLREAKALCSIRHPGLPTVFGIGLHRGWPYLLMERLFGVTLEEHLDKRGRPLTLDEGVTILADIAEVLAAVHSAGMAHRDLKPSNVMLSPGRTVLLDFGIVLPEVIARDGGRCGTPRYLAPELVVDRVKPGTAFLVDTYAFGVMAYELFTGRPPFEADNVIQLMEHHLQSPPPHLLDVREDLPRALCDLILACMAKDPLDRPQDMQSVTWELRNLRRLGTDGSGPVRMPSGAQSARETYRRQETDPAMRVTNPWEVLVVDDDPENREVLAIALKEHGFRARAATHGADALDLIRRTGWRPSVILLDLMMPVMDGYQFLAAQARDPLLDSIPIVLTTAQPADETRRYSAVRGIFSKPVPLPALIGLLRDVCRRERGTGA